MTTEPVSLPDSAVEMTPVMQMRRVLDVLAERVAAIVEEGRRPDDIDDSKRGVFFPPALIIRDARSLPAGHYANVLTEDELPESLLRLAAAGGLTYADVALLLIAASPALQPRFEHFYTVLNNEIDTRGPMIQTAIRLAGFEPDDPQARARFRIDAPLMALGLIDAGPADRALPTQVIGVPERVITYLLGDERVDPLITGFIQPMPDPLVPFHLMPEISGLPMGTVGPIVLRARAGTAGRLQAQRLIESDSGSAPLLVEGSGLDSRPLECSQQIRACIREAALAGCGLVIDLRQAEPGLSRSDILNTLGTTGIPVVALIETRGRLDRWTGPIVDLPLPSADERRQWWRSCGASSEQEQNADSVTHLDPDDILLRLQGAPPAQFSQGGGRDGMAQRVQPEFTLADLVLEPGITRDLRELRDRVRFRSVVLDEWGMRPGGGRGRGITALFAGPPGTGKSMAAEALAGELGVPLFRVELAAVVDKYIGETEKNLDRVFSAVEDHDGVLLFDEADALFGKRSDVSDARDRYANLEVAYLLQRMESFDGLAVLTTNLRSNLDAAFLRRLDSAVDFGEPGPKERVRLWRTCLGEHCADLTDVDVARLAELQLTGGSIRAAAVTAGYLAAESGRHIERIDVVNAAEREWRKLGRLSFPLAGFLAEIEGTGNAVPGASR